MRFIKNNVLAILCGMLALHLLCGQTLLATQINLDNNISAESSPQHNTFALTSIVSVLADASSPFGKNQFTDRTQNFCTHFVEYKRTITINRNSVSFKNINRKTKGLWLLKRAILS